MGILSRCRWFVQRYCVVDSVNEHYVPSRRTSTVLTLLTSGNLEAEATADTTAQVTSEAMAEAKKVTILSVDFFFHLPKK